MLGFFFSEWLGLNVSMISYLNMSLNNFMLACKCSDI